jgi:hypothetical protein
MTTHTLCLAGIVRVACGDSDKTLLSLNEYQLRKLAADAAHAVLALDSIKSSQSAREEHTRIGEETGEY